MTGPGLTIAGPAGQVQMAPGQNRGGFREIPPTLSWFLELAVALPLPSGSHPSNPLHPALFYVSL